MITCGVDIGSRTIEIVLFEGSEVLASSVINSGASPAENARKEFLRLIESSGIGKGRIRSIAATGYGRNYFGEADTTASEILCHAKGVSRLFPSARTVIDIGGQDSKMISLGENGKVLNFVMNDRCAAGTGKFIEMVGMMLDVPLGEMAEMTSNGTKPCEISSMCAVFAESEIIGLTQSGVAPESVLKGVFRSVAKRTLTMSGRIALKPDVVFTGGVARNGGVVRALEEETGIMLLIPEEPRITGALGAAIIAAEKLLKAQPDTTAGRAGA